MLKDSLGIAYHARSPTLLIVCEIHEGKIHREDHHSPYGPISRRFYNGSAYFERR